MISTGIIRLIAAKGVLPAKFDTKKTKKSEFPITIEADDEVTNGTIVKLFDVIRVNGYAAVNIRTKEKR